MFASPRPRPMSALDSGLATATMKKRQERAHDNEPGKGAEVQAHTGAAGGGEPRPARRFRRLSPAARTGGVVPGVRAPGARSRSSAGALRRVGADRRE